MVESQRDSKSYLKIDDGVKHMPVFKRRGPKHLRAIVLAYMRDFVSGGLCVIDFFFNRDSSRVLYGAL